MKTTNIIQKVSVALVVFITITMFNSAMAQELISFEKGEKYGFKNEKGKVVVKAIYDYAFEFSEGMAVVNLKDKYGFIDKTGKLFP